VALESAASGDDEALLAALEEIEAAAATKRKQA
jgi:hypothetical protein